jgi:hypothetical protein
VLLRRPVSATDYPDEELERIQREHLAYHARLREAGQVVTNGGCQCPASCVLWPLRGRSGRALLWIEALLAEQSAELFDLLAEFADLLC